jgi:hypothetical protein
MRTYAYERNDRGGRTWRDARRIAGICTCAIVTVATSLVGPMAISAHAADGSSGLVPTTWDCTNGDTASFLLPAAAVSPAAGAVVAPFPGFLVGVDGPTPMVLGTYIVTGSATTSPLPTSFGRKVGVVANGTAVCTLEGAPVTVTIAPAR